MNWCAYRGRFAPTAAVGHLLARRGSRGPEAVREPEAWLLAAGGLGFGYRAYRGPWGLHLALELTRPAGSGVFLQDACRRLGLAVEVEEISNARLAAKRLETTLEASGSVVVWGAAAALPWSDLRPDLVPLVEHVWVVEEGADDPGVFRALDLAPEPLPLTAEQLATARSAPFAVQHRQLWLPEATPEAPWEPPAPGHLLEPTVSGLRAPLLPGQGLGGLEQWGRWLAGDEALPRSRRQVVRDGTEILDVLVEIWRAVVGRTGGGALRDLWADFLDRAAGRWGAAATAYRRLAGRWNELAAAALPEFLGLARVRETLEERNRIFRQAGPGPALEELDRRFATRRHELGAALDPGSGAVDTLFAELAERVADLAEAEREALAALSPEEPAV